MLDKLIRDMKEKGLMSIMPMRIIGKAKPVFDMWALMVNTRPMEQLEAVDFSRN